MVLSFLTTPYRAPAECVITVDGAPLDDLYPFLSSVSVESSRVEAAQGTLEFESRRDEHGEWTVQDVGSLRNWASIVIEAAFGSKTEAILRGHIREVNATYPADTSQSKVTVKCQDQSYALDREHRRRPWGEPDAPTTDAVIVNTILRSHGLAGHPENGTGLGELVVLQDSTDIRFLRKRAQVNGYELIFGTEDVYFGPMRVASEPQPTVMVYAGTETNCLSFDIRDDGHKPDSVTYNRASDAGVWGVSRLDLMGTEPANSSGSGLDTFTWRLTDQGTHNAQEIQAIAQGRADEMAMKVSADGELDGTMYGHVLRVGEPVGVDGVGSRYGGIYYVDAVTHRFTETGYRQQFKLLRNAYGDNLESTGSLLGGV